MNRRSLFRALLGIPVFPVLPALSKVPNADPSQNLIPQVAASPDEILEARAFYAGYQWPLDVLRARSEAGRPCLVINRFAVLTDKRIFDAEAAIQRRLTEHECEMVIVDSYRRAGDSQRAYNYARSATAELDAGHDSFMAARMAAMIVAAGVDMEVALL